MNEMSRQLWAWVKAKDACGWTRNVRWHGEYCSSGPLIIMLMGLLSVVQNGKFQASNGLWMMTRSWHLFGYKCFSINYNKWCSIDNNFGEHWHTHIAISEVPILSNRNFLTRQVTWCGWKNYTMDLKQAITEMTHIDMAEEVEDDKKSWNPSSHVNPCVWSSFWI